MKLLSKNEYLKSNKLSFKIDLKIFNKNNKVYKKKIIPLKILVHQDSTSSQ